MPPRYYDWAQLLYWTEWDCSGIVCLPDCKPWRTVSPEDELCVLSRVCCVGSTVGFGCSICIVGSYVAVVKCLKPLMCCECPVTVINTYHDKLWGWWVVSSLWFVTTNSDICLFVLWIKLLPNNNVTVTLIHICAHHATVVDLLAVTLQSTRDLSWSPRSLGRGWRHRTLSDWCRGACMRTNIKADVIVSWNVFISTDVPTTHLVVIHNQRVYLNWMEEMFLYLSATSTRSLWLTVKSLCL